jgi:hypothetical protein
MFRAAATLAVCLVALAGCGAPSDPASETTFVCNAQQRWQDTGVYLAAGERFRITWASGFWTPAVAHGLWTPAGLVARAAPGSPMPGAPSGALIGRVGTDSFLIGEDVETVATQSGQLYCAMNDTLTDTYGRPLLENAGQVTMRITTTSWQDRASCPFAHGCDTFWRPHGFNATGPLN